jgi:D-alanine-D-alanine ligase
MAPEKPRAPRPVKELGRELGPAGPAALTVGAMSLRVAVVQGGPSSEAAVSRVSASAVARALGNLGHTVTLLELDRALPAALGGASVDVVFPVVHGALGEDGCLQGLCELLGLPYVGSGVLASALATDKVQAKRLFRAAGLPLAEQFVALRAQGVAACERGARQALGPAIAVKPATQGSAIGVTLVGPDAPPGALAEALEAAFEFDEIALCERFVRGREVTCGVTDAPSLGGLHALPPTEIKANLAHFYDFASRYASGGSVHVCPPDLPPEVVARVQSVAVAAHQALACRDLSRADFVVGDGDDANAVTLLEVNTMPGMTPTSLYPEAMQKAGVSFEAMCAAFLASALERPARRAVRVLPMPP